MNEKDKERLHETRLSKTVNSLRDQGLTNSEDYYRALGNLAEFYSYKGRSDLAAKMHKELAEQELKNALNGGGDDIGHFNELMHGNVLKDKFFVELRDGYQKNPDHFTRSKYHHLIEEGRLTDHVASLVEIYKDLEKKTWNKRKKYGLPIIQLSDKALQLDLEERLKKRKGNQHNE